MVATVSTVIALLGKVEVDNDRNTLTKTRKMESLVRLNPGIIMLIPHFKESVQNLWKPGASIMENQEKSGSEIN